MKPIIKILPIALLLYTSVSKGYESDSISNNVLNLGSDQYQLSATNRNKGLLETTKITIGSIYKSHHFRDNNYNETHNGIYENVEGWSLGTYENSSNAQSVFVTYNPSLYRNNSLEVWLPE